MSSGWGKHLQNITTAYTQADATAVVVKPERSRGREGGSVREGESERERGRKREGLRGKFREPAALSRGANYGDSRLRCPCLASPALLGVGGCYWLGRRQ